jgi:hypothetical protein
VALDTGMNILGLLCSTCGGTVLLTICAKGKIERIAMEFMLLELRWAFED